MDISIVYRVPFEIFIDLLPGELRGHANESDRYQYFMYLEDKTFYLNSFSLISNPDRKLLINKFKKDLDQAEKLGLIEQAMNI